jgi:hypothetical protein
MISWNSRTILLLASLWLVARPGLAEQEYQPQDPFAAIDGDPVYVGEIQLVLADRVGLEKLPSVGEDVKRATALLLVRRRLAMRSLEAAGGEALQSLIDRRLQSIRDELSRRNSSLSRYAEGRRVTENAVVADLTWKVAWGQYVKSKLTDENLRRFFDQHRAAYGGGDFDDLADHGKLRRAATNALFDTLVRKQSQTKVQWFIPALQPPDGVLVIPK